MRGPTTEDPGSALQLVSWNVHQLQVWDRSLLTRRACLAPGLLQEAPPPPSSPFPEEGTGLADVVPKGDPVWETAGCDWRPWRTAVVRLSPKIGLDPIHLGDITADAQTLCVSRPGTVTAATVLRNGEALFNVASVYAAWGAPAHRPIADLGGCLRAPLAVRLDPAHPARGLPLVISGDWNILRGYGEHGDRHYGQRYQTVFDRAEALGLRSIGPGVPVMGPRADPWPDELPAGSTCVPTYYQIGKPPRLPHGSSTSSSRPRAIANGPRHRP